MFVLLVTMSSVLLNHGFALSSHFDSDGAPLSELSWSSSLAVVAISFSGLFTFVFLMLACLCCKKGNGGFKEFQNVDGEEYHADLSTLASPASQSGPEVYILPLTEVSLPVAKQPARSVQLLKSTDLGRHSLLYLKEIGHGWFGKVLLGEVNAGLNTTQVVVKELKASASVQDQMHFLEEAQPYRALQHPALLQCLAQCTEVTPYLLVMEFCPLGDVKGYLRSCRAADTITPEPLILQRMACDIASGLLHLHKHNFAHRGVTIHLQSNLTSSWTATSRDPAWVGRRGAVTRAVFRDSSIEHDLALRNCLLTADVSVKIGDYGLSHTKYKDDYYVTSDQMYVPLRWIAPELVDEVHGNLLVADQTQQSNIWSLGVTIWELFELGNQPYRHYSDRQVLTYAVREQQLRLPKPLLKVPLAERWYEVMQFCWLQPDQRPNAEEVHLLLSYLCAKGASEAEEDFERRWNSLRPNAGHGYHRSASAMPPDHPSSSSSSFPLLEQFSAGDGYHSESGDDILTVTETSHGLNFEYKWEQARAEQPYHVSASSGTLGQVNHHCQDAFYPPGGIVGGCPMEGLSLGVSPSYYQPKQLHAPGVVPVLSAHSPSLSSEYYIRIEEPVDCNIDLDYTMCSYSPDYQGSSGSFLTGSADSGECMACPSQVKNMGSYWSADKTDMYDSHDSSPAISLTMEPLLGQVSDSSPLRPWESGHYVSYKDRDGGYYFEHSPTMGIEHHYLIGGEPPVEPHQESWGSRSLRQALGELENPLGISPSVNTPPQQAYRDNYLDTSQGSIIGKNVTGGYYDMMGSLRKTMPLHTGHARHSSHSVSINMETERALFIGHRDSDSEEEEEEDIFLERHTCNTWPAKHGHSSLGHHRRASHSCRQDAYVDFHYTMPSTDIEDSWPEEHSLTFHSLPKPIDYLEPHQAKDNSTCLSLSKHHTMAPSDNCNAYVYLCHEGETHVPVPGECCHSHFVDPLTGLLVRNYSHNDYVRDKVIEIPCNEESVNLSPAPGGPTVAKPVLVKTDTPTTDSSQSYVDLSIGDTVEKKEDLIKEVVFMQHEIEPKVEEVTLTMTGTAPPPTDDRLERVALTEPESELSHTADSGVDQGCSSANLVDILDCSDDDEDDDMTDDITDITSGIFADESSELNASPAFKSLQKQVGTPDSMDSMDLPSAAGSCEGFSPASSHPSSSPKAMDSGYDTENNESPEFVPKEPHEPRDQPSGKPTLNTSLEEEEELEEEGMEAETICKEGEPSLGEDLALAALQTDDHVLAPLSDKNPYRDSAYFSDYENERLSRDEGDELPENARDEENVGEEDGMTEKRGEKRKKEEEEEVEDSMALLKENIGTELEIKHTSIGLTEQLSPPQETEAYLTGECSEDEGPGPVLGPSESASAAEVGLDEWPSQEESSSLGDWAAEVVGAMEEVLVALNGDCISAVQAEEEEEEEEEAEDVKDSTQALQTIEEPAIKTIQSRSSGNSGEIPHTLPKDEVALQHTASARRLSSSSPPPPSTPPPPLPPTEAWPSPADGEEADGEDADSDDSEESDEELRSYSVQEQSAGEESEDECHPVPIVVSDSSDAHNLRSLLKMPTLLTSESLEDELERKKKVVSFFDDVTVYLFDQESPTKELVEHGFPLSTEGQSSHSKHQEKVHASDDSSDGNISEESAGYEWEDDFPLLPLPTSKMASDSPPPRSTPKAPETKPAVQYSRFTVSPSNVSRFSITHVSDSDMDSVGGSSEDGDRE